MTLETIKMSSKGQIVIPQDIREELNAGEGTLFGVMRSKDTLILRKINTPSKQEIIKDLVLFSKESRKKLEAQGLTEQDVIRIAVESRHKK
ncbi:MAG: hypothetical protein AABX51_06980 [Nanoarchaeota archaeon]